MKEIVMCKFCKNYKFMSCNNTHFCDEYGGYVTEEDFCSRGEMITNTPTTQPRKVVKSDEVSENRSWI